MRWFAILLALAIALPAMAQKRIALTFDDIPRFTGPVLSREQRQQMLLAELKKARVRQAAFFVNPGSLGETGSPADEGAILRYAKAGHVLANHSDTHPRLSQSSAASYLANIDAAEHWLKGRKGRRPWFRYPFLDEGGNDKAKRDAVRAGLRARGLRNAYVTAESSDWHIQSLWMEAVAVGKTVDRKLLCDFYARHHLAAADFADDLARKTLGRSPAHLMLLHETDLAAFCLNDLVVALRGGGWKIITADRAYTDPLKNAAPDVPSAQGTILEMLAWQKGVPAPRWYAYNNTDLLTADFNQKVLRETPGK